MLRAYSSKKALSSWILYTSEHDADPIPRLCAVPVDRFNGTNQASLPRLGLVGKPLPQQRVRNAVFLALSQAPVTLAMTFRRAAFRVPRAPSNVCLASTTRIGVNGRVRLCEVVPAALLVVCEVSPSDMTCGRKERLEWLILCESWSATMRSELDSLLVMPAFANATWDVRVAHEGGSKELHAGSALNPAGEQRVSSRSIRVDFAPIMRLA